MDTNEETTFLSNLPLDILDSILIRLDLPDLAKCCRTSKALYPLAKDALYRDLRLSCNNVLKACQKLTADADLARRVQTLVLIDNTVQLHLGVIQDALLILPNLRTLVLAIGYFGSWILPQGRKCPFQLHTFRCGFLYDASTAMFLSSQLLLKSLAVNSVSSGGEEFRPTHHPCPASYPNLTTLFAPLSVVQDIVPGRPVENITTSSSEGDVDPDLLTCLARSTAPNGVQRFMIDYKYIRSIGGTALARAVPNLCYLSIDANDINPAHDKTISVLTEYVEDILSCLQQMKCITIRFHPSLSTLPCRTINFQDLVTRAFETSPYLKYVIITFFGLRARYVCKSLPGFDWYLCAD
ncbi:hypothetical protein BDQ12DRAFT_465414 [Crucibulum laeve]|uniref:F-box domain-containing protein n=1 Tax=Crucibulum laeve TaxID=68775 RepID=A0A5C3M5X1_9AGAR|nr:hypothetical protein BDQ12DRAFT_465414 [Crucibulum laeve]